MDHAIDRKRWLVKKAARALVASGSAALGGPKRMARRKVIRAITYHRFGDSTRDPFCVTAAELEQQLAYLAKHRLAISQDDLLAFVHGEREIEGSILVTIDDGHRSVADIAAPLFRRYAVPAVAFVVTNWVGGAEWMTWEQLRALPASGIEVGSHSRSHRSMARIPRDEATIEADTSRQALEQHLARKVASFAYPYGTKRDFDAGTGAVLADTGYACAFTSQHGAIAPGDAALALPRVKVEGGDPPWLFAALCHGAMDAWRFVDRALYRLQRPTH